VRRRCLSVALQFADVLLRVERKAELFDQSKLRREKVAGVRFRLKIAFKDFLDVSPNPQLV
jgi:hypothetical protein